MLGWFKKKKKQPESEPVESQEVSQNVSQELSQERTRLAPAERGDSGPPKPAEEMPGVSARPVPEPPVIEDLQAQPVPEAVAEPAPEAMPEPLEAAEIAAIDPSGTRVVEAEAPVAARTEKKKSTSMFKRLSERLAKTRESLTQRMDELFLGKKEIDAELFDDLEEILVTADLGIATTQELLEFARKKVNREGLSDPRALKQIIKDQLKSFMRAGVESAELSLPEGEPFVIMVVGVNGVGKTTTIGKIARKFQKADRSVLLVAADTFRAAAASQLKIWGERNEVRVISQHEGADPSSVVYDAMSVAKDQGYDVVLVDTAGRLHTKVNLMEELKKIKRVMDKQLAGAPHEVLLVIDATTGQNGISQATLFNDAIGVTGIALTKLDGTAKGGIVATITRELQLPIRFIGVGEKAEDLRDFSAEEFIEALFASA